MTDPTDERDLDALFARARSLRAPAGARERVLAQTERALAGRPRATARKVALGGLALAFVSAAASALWLAPSWQTPARSRPEPSMDQGRSAHEARRRNSKTMPKPEPMREPPAPSEPIAPSTLNADKGRELDRHARGRSSPGPSELALQVKAYRQALALRGRDDARAIELWREMTRRWPHSPLRHEIDLSVIDALVRLGRSAEARGEARGFLERHPGSSKAAVVRSMLGDSGVSQ